MHIVIAAMLAAAPPSPTAPGPNAELQRLQPRAVAATSALKSNWNRYEENYHPLYAVDDDPKTAWVEGKADAGKGESITLNTVLLPGAQRLQLVIMNGYQKSDKLLAMNSAPTAITVTVRGVKGAMSAEQKIVLERKMGPQVFDVPLKAGIGQVTLRIDDVIAGSKWQDTCVSDVQLHVQLPPGKKLDALEQERTRAALTTWRKQRIETAKKMKSILAQSDFAAATFTATEDDEDNCKLTEDDASDLASLRRFVAGNDPSDVAWFVPPEVPFLPDGLSLLADDEAFVTKATMKGLEPHKGSGRQEFRPDCGACDADAKVYTTHVAVELEGGKAVRAFRGHRTHHANDYGYDGESGTVFVFDDKGRTTSAVSYLIVAHPEGTLESITSAKLTWSPTGKIVKAVVLDPVECTRTTFVAEK